MPDPVPLDDILARLALTPGLGAAVVLAGLREVGGPLDREWDADAVREAARLLEGAVERDDGGRHE